MRHQMEVIKKNIRRWLVFFMVSLVLSGLTALDVENGIWWLGGHFGPGPIQDWISKVLAAVRETGLHHRFLFYGYDWLAFAHLVIAVAFIGPYKDPVRNKWVIQFGRIAACMVIPFALIAGGIRGIPLWWQLVDCSFGIIALWPLGKCYRLIEKLERLEEKEAALEKPKSKCQYHLLMEGKDDLFFK